MYAKRLLVVLAIAMVPRLAGAAVTMTPSTLAAGNVLVNGMGTSPAGTLSDSAHLVTVDLAIVSCSGGGTGTFTLSQTTNISLATDQMITTTYSPTARGARQCT